jgi:bacteriocin-like protein
MNELTKSELQDINGGWIWVGRALATYFIIETMEGIADGVKRECKHEK